MTHVFLLGTDAIKSPTDYVHVSGRVGRFSRGGKVVTFIEGEVAEGRMNRLYKKLDIVPTAVELDMDYSEEVLGRRNPLRFDVFSFPSFTVMESAVSLVISIIPVDSSQLYLDLFPIYRLRAIPPNIWRNVHRAKAEQTELGCLSSASSAEPGGTSIGVLLKLGLHQYCRRRETQTVAPVYEQLSFGFRS